MRPSTSFTALMIILGLAQGARAHSPQELRRGSDLRSLSLADLATEVPRGAIVVIGEKHGVAEFRDFQVAVLGALRAAGHLVSVGLEFFPAQDQKTVDAWRQGTLAEPDFLKQVDWTSPSFDFYRQQALFPRLVEGSLTVALNAPRLLTGRVAQVGLEGLTNDEKAELPPGMTLGRDSYRRRFMETMPHLPDGDAAANRYFAAQSVWDDTMAFTASEFMKAHPEQTLVIVVGEFHVQYGGGLPARLRARLGDQASILSLSQVDLSGLSEDEIQSELDPSTAEGPRADWIWAEGRVPQTSP